MVGTRQGLAVIHAITMGLVFVGMLVVNSEAAVTFSNPVRSVSATNNKGSSQEIISNDFGQFNESARVDWEEYWSYPNHFSGPFPNTTGQYYSKATQESIIGLSGVTARGSVIGTGSFEFYGQNALQQYSHSYFKVDFSIDSPSDIYLKGTVYCYSDTNGTNNDYTEITLTLSGVNGDVYSRTIGQHGQGDDYYQGYNFPYEINESFTSLAAGEYEFEVSLNTTGRYNWRNAVYDGADVYFVEPGVGGGGIASYDITLVPEPSAMLLAGLAGVLLIRRKR